jgi:hypothetical protein
MNIVNFQSLQMRSIYFACQQPCGNSFNVADAFLINASKLTAGNISDITKLTMYIFQPAIFTRLLLIIIRANIHW